jgi:hypothetical protein
LPNELKSSGERLTDRLNLREKQQSNKHMSDDLEKIILEMRDDIKDVKQYIGERDIMTNSEYCKLRKIAKPTLIGWFKKDCPRVDSHNVSKKAVDDWARSNNTRKKK